MHGRESLLDEHASLPPVGVSVCAEMLDLVGVLRPGDGRIGYLPRRLAARTHGVVI
jgi:hypothetical protein